MNRNFRQLLEAQWDNNKFLCVGLDTDIAKIPESATEMNTRETIVAFNRAIVDATKDVASAYKFNSAFYETHSDEGWEALRESIAYILDTIGSIPVILDAKRGDIDNTNRAYAESAFDHLRVDAITVHPYLGAETFGDFLSRPEKGTIVVCRTSNRGASEFQDLKIDSESLYKVVARHVNDSWNKNGNCGLVVGATYPEELKEVRAIVGDMPLLIPGIGAQGGDIEKTVRAGRDSRGRGMIISAARSIIYASSGKDFAGAAALEAKRLDSAIREALLQ